MSSINRNPPALAVGRFNRKLPEKLITKKPLITKKKYRKPKIDSYGFFSHDLASYITDQNWKRG